MVSGEVGARCELKAVKGCGQAEHCVDAVLKFEIRLEGALVQGISCLLVLLAPVAEIPGHKFSLKALLLGIGDNLCYFIACCRKRGGEQLVEEGVYLGGCLDHALFEGVVGECRISKNVGNLYTMVNYIFDYLAVVILARGGPAVIGHVHFFPEVTPRGVLHKRGVAGIAEVENPAFLALLRGGLLAEGYQKFGQSFKFRLVGKLKCERVGGGEYVLAER